MVFHIKCRCLNWLEYFNSEVVVNTCILCTILNTMTEFLCVVIGIRLYRCFLRLCVQPWFALGLGYLLWCTVLNLLFEVFLQYHVLHVFMYFVVPILIFITCCWCWDVEGTSYLDWKFLWNSVFLQSGAIPF